MTHTKRWSKRNKIHRKIISMLMRGHRRRHSWISFQDDKNKRVYLQTFCFIRVSFERLEPEGEVVSSLKSPFDPIYLCMKNGRGRSVPSDTVLADGKDCKSHCAASDFGDVFRSLKTMCLFHFVWETRDSFCPETLSWSDWKEDVFPFSETQHSLSFRYRGLRFVIQTAFLLYITWSGREADMTSCSWLLAFVLLKNFALCLSFIFSSRMRGCAPDLLMLLEWKTSPNKIESQGRWSFCFPRKASLEKIVVSS